MKTLIEDLNPTHLNLDMTSYDQKTAIYCVQLSEVAYWRKKSKIQNLVNQLHTQYPNFTHYFEMLDDKKSGTPQI